MKTGDSQSPETEQLTRMSEPTPAAVMKRFSLKLGAENDALVAAQTTHTSALKKLLQAKQFDAAIEYLAFALRKREAVLWACVAARGALGDDPPREPVELLAAAEAWIRQPDEERRAAALATAEAREDPSPSRFAAMAAGFCGGSLTPPELDEVPPPDDLSGKLVLNALKLILLANPPEELEAQQQALLGRGISIAQRAAANRRTG